MPSWLCLWRLVAAALYLIYLFRSHTSPAPSQGDNVSGTHNYFFIFTHELGTLPLAVAALSSSMSWPSPAR